MSIQRNAVFAVLVMSVVGMVGTSTASVYAQSSSSSSLSGSFASITTEQSGDKIVITITKEPGAGNVTLPEVPEGPIIIVPDPAGEGNGTVIVPEPPVSNETTTTPGNETAEPPVVVIPPDGNVTQVEQPANVTVIDNDTVIVTPPTDNITQIPLEPETPAAGNETTSEEPTDEVIVITPPAPEPCGCPTEPVAEEPAIAPGDNVTVTEPAEPQPDDNFSTGPTLPIDETGSQPVQPPNGDEPPPEFNTSQPQEFFRT